jgi:DUF1680 family protein
MSFHHAPAIPSTCPLPRNRSHPWRWLALGVACVAVIHGRSDNPLTVSGAWPRPPALRDVVVTDGFWAPRLKVLHERTIPHSWTYVQGEIRALRKAAGQNVEGDLNGTWGEANLYKFLETVGHSLAQHPDPELERRIDEIVVLIAAAQQPDGYAHAYVTNSKKLPWDPDFLDGSHDGYVLGHLIEAAIAYAEATGKTAFLEVARRAADEAHRHFLGPDGQPGFCGHAELEMALVELFRVTGEPRYLELSKAFVEWRGRGMVKPAGPTPRAYFQDGVPVREQPTLEGHAVRALFFATGVADLALETGDADYRRAANRYWDSTAGRRMNITGGVGPREEHEAFGEDYELPHQGYYESCAACGLADFAQRMGQLEVDAATGDVLERVLYNAVLHGLSLDGTNSYYQNPLSDRDRPRYNSWVCCPPNLSRTLMQIGRYAAMYRPSEIWLQLFIGGSYRFPLATGPVTLTVETGYPWDGNVRAVVRSPAPARFALNLRRPDWCEKATVRVNGETLATDRVDRGFIRIEREWRDGEVVELVLEMPVQRWVAHPNVQSCRGQVAVQRGPLVYGFEGLDNEGIVVPALPADPRFAVEMQPDLLGGVRIIRGVDDQGRRLTGIPFFALANRAKSTQEVWADQRALKSDSSWWLGRLYRRLDPVTMTPQ